MASAHEIKVKTNRPVPPARRNVGAMTEGTPYYSVEATTYTVRLQPVLSIPSVVPSKHLSMSFRRVWTHLSLSF